MSTWAAWARVAKSLGWKRFSPVPERTPVSLAQSTAAEAQGAMSASSA